MDRANYCLMWETKSCKLDNGPERLASPNSKRRFTTLKQSKPNCQHPFLDNVPSRLTSSACLADNVMSSVASLADQKFSQAEETMIITSSHGRPEALPDRGDNHHHFVEMSVAMYEGKTPVQDTCKGAGVVNKLGPFQSFTTNPNGANVNLILYL